MVEMILPLEMWDLILEFLPGGDLIKTRIISCSFLDLIDLNKKFRIKI